MTKSVPTKSSRGRQGFLSRDPFGMLQEEMEDLLSRFSSDWDSGWLTGNAVPAMDVSETEDSLQVRMDMPGMKPEDIDININNSMLHVRGERTEEREEKGKTWHRSERRVGSMARSISLPCPVDEDKVQAECREGVLTITLPKSQEARSRKIPVKGNGA